MQITKKGGVQRNWTPMGDLKKTKHSTRPKEGKKKTLVYTNHRKTTTPERAITSSRTPTNPSFGTAPRVSTHTSVNPFAPYSARWGSGMLHQKWNIPIPKQNNHSLTKRKTVTMLHYTARKSDRTLHPLTNTARRRKRNQHSTTSYANWNTSLQVITQGPYVNEKIRSAPKYNRSSN